MGRSTRRSPSCRAVSSDASWWHARWRARDPKDLHNPVYVPRNHLVEEALATQDVQPLLDVLTRPYDERRGLERFTEPGTTEGYRTFCGT